MVFFCVCGSTYALNLADWRYRADVIAEKGTGKYCQLTIVPQIYDLAKSDLTDIRLVDSDGNQVPYVLSKPVDRRAKKEFSPAIINRSIDKDNSTMVTLDFGKQEIKNSVEVVTDGSNFRRAVRVEGSNDNVKFFAIVENAYVFAAGPGENRRFEQIDMPVNDYRYLRVAVRPMAAEEKKGPVISGVKTFKIGEELAARQPIGMILAEHKEDPNNNLSSYIYDLSYRRLPVSGINLAILNDSFYRCVTVEGRDETTRRVQLNSEDNRQRFKEVEVPWQMITCDTIYRYTAPDGKPYEKLTLHIGTGRYVYRFLRISIKNYDDKPLVVKSAVAEAILHDLRFAPDGNKRLVLYFGSETAAKPQYDLTRWVGDVHNLETNLAQLGGIVDNPLLVRPSEKTIPWTEKHKTLLLVFMAAAVCVLGLFIFKSLKSISKEDQSGGN